MKIVFLLYNAYGIGGTIRSVVNLSAALSARHSVRIVSVHRTVDTPQSSIDPRVTLTSLIDWRPDAPECAADETTAAQPSEMFTDDGVRNGPLAPSRLTDLRVAEYLRSTDAGVVIATRPVLNGYLARYGSRRQVRIGQEHVLLQVHGDGVRRKKTDVFPAAVAEGPGGTPCRVGPYFTAHQMLALAVEPVAEAPAAAAAVRAPARGLLARRDG